MDASDSPHDDHICRELPENIDQLCSQSLSGSAEHFTEPRGPPAPRFGLSGGQALWIIIKSYRRVKRGGRGCAS